MNSQVACLAVALWISFALIVTARAAPAYPLKASANKRYLVDQNNQPVLLVGDSPHALFANLSMADATTYLRNRGANGFNALWCEVLVTPATGGRANLSTYDGILPFTTPNDISTPNSTYFARVDQMIAIAAANGLTVVLDTFETSYLHSFLTAQTATKMFNYGVFLGNRYKNTPNIIWITGNDFQYWNTDPTANNLIKELMRGIASVDPNHLQSLQLNFTHSGSLDNTLIAPYVTLNGVYNYYVTYDEVLIQYNKPNYLPVYLQEAAYEDESNFEEGTPNLLRRQAYWTVLAGGLGGQMYGHLDIWRFSDGWQNSLNSTGVRELGHWRTFLTSKAWYDLVPDQNHTVVTAGYGTYKTAESQTFGSANDYVTTARTPDGTLVLAYTPMAHTLKVDMTKLAGSVTARWFDPASGSYSSIAGSPFANTGTLNFTTPGNNSAGAGNGDWVLVLEAEASQSDTPSPGTYNGLFDEDDQVRQRSSGFFTTSVTSRGTYSGRLQMGANRLRFSGQLNAQGQATNIIPRSDNSALTVELQLGTGDQIDQILGRVTDGTWVATLRGDRAVFSSKSNPSPYARRYVLVIPGQDNDPSMPAGESFGTVRVDASGKVRFAGTLADGTKVSQGTSLSKDGHWPFYVAPYSGNGSVLSWLTFANRASDDINGMLSWIKPAGTKARYYVNGFTHESEAIGSVYVPPVGRTDQVLNLTNASVIFSDGNLALDFTNAVVLGPGSRVSNLSSNRFAMSFSSSAGTFRGKATDPATGQSLSFNGGVLQKLNAGYGFFLGTNQSGRVGLTP